MERIINTALMVIGVVVWVYRKYGITAMVTKDLARHAAPGRAKRTWFGPVRDHRQRCYDAATLINQLRHERTMELLRKIESGQTTFALAA